MGEANAALPPIFQTLPCARYELNNGRGGLGMLSCQAYVSLILRPVLVAIRSMLLRAIQGTGDINLLGVRAQAFARFPDFHSRGGRKYANEYLIHEEAPSLHRSGKRNPHH